MKNNRSEVNSIYIIRKSGCVGIKNTSPSMLLMFQELLKVNLDFMVVMLISVNV